MSLLSFATGAAPGSAQNGYLSVYAKTDGLLYTKDQNGLERQISTVSSPKNAVINGGMMVAQRADLTISSSAPAANAGYGKVDRFQCWGTGTSVSAGTATQDTASGIGRTGYALKLSGVTITGTGIVFVRHRIETVNSIRFKNQTASLSCVVKHDVGSSINYTLTVRKANSADTFSATTSIQAGNATSVTTGTETTLKLEAISMGDCSNGIEIEIKAECGAVTTKNFWVTEVQLEVNPASTFFEHIDYTVELNKCLRYYEFCDAHGYGIPGYVYTTTSGISAYMYKVKKRALATIESVTYSNGGYVNGNTACTFSSLTGGGGSIDHTRIDFSGISPSTTGGYAILVYCKFGAAAEL